MPRTQVFQQVLEAVNPNTLVSGDHALIAVRTRVRGPDCDVIGLYPEVLEAFLNRDSDGASAAPEADQEIRSEVGMVNGGGKLERVAQQVVGGDDALVHGSVTALRFTVGFRTAQL